MLLLLEHLFGAMVVSVCMNLMGLVLPVADVYFQVKQLPLVQQRTVLDNLEQILRREGLTL